MNVRNVRVLTLSLLLVGCTPTCSKPTSAYFENHPIKHLPYWERFGTVPLAERLFDAPPEILEYLHKDNLKNDVKGTPVVATISPELTRDFRTVLSVLPPKVAQLLDEKLLGVFFVRDLGTSAYTELVRDERNYAVAAWMAFDVDVLKRSGNDWLTWKENTPFKSDSNLKIEGQLADPASDSPYETLEFLLLHEFAHVIAQDEDIHPDWALPPSAAQVAEYPYFALSWTVRDGRYYRRTDDRKALPEPVTYYSDGPFRPDAIGAVSDYVWLSESDFVTLYAATNPFDDFADSLATYIHTQVYKKPFTIRIHLGGEREPLEFPACWDEQRCAAKRAALEAFLK